MRIDQISGCLSIPLRHFRRPPLRPADAREVDAVEEHRELRGVELSAERFVVEGRQPEAALLQALVVEDKAAVVPGEDLHPVTAPRDEGEEVTRVDVLLPITADDRRQPIDAVAQIHWLACEQDSNRPWEEEHRLLPEGSAQLGQVSGIAADREAHDRAAAQLYLDQHPLHHPRFWRG